MNVILQCDKKEAMSGVCSFASWPSLQRQIEKAFGCSPPETIRAIVVNTDGITAYFEDCKENPTDA